MLLLKITTQVTTIFLFLGVLHQYLCLQPAAIKKYVAGVLLTYNSTSLQLTNNPFGSFQDYFLRLVPVAATKGSTQPPVVSAIQVRKNTVAVRKRPIRSLGGLLRLLIPDGHIVDIRQRANDA